MMINTLLFLLGVCCAFSSAGEDQPADNAYTGPQEKLHVYLLIGQSNMAGRAPIDDSVTAPIDRAYLLNREGMWEKAENPLNRYSTIRKDAGMQKLNPGYTFATTMLEQEKGVSIGLVVNARGGTNIDQWAKGGDYYNAALRRVAQARKTGTLKGILWHQGEADRDQPDGYLEKLAKLIADLREDLDEPDLPFIAGQVKGVTAINDQIARLPDTVANTAFASSDGLTTQDEFHFDTRSMKLLGQRYAQALIKLRQEKADALAEADKEPADPQQNSQPAAEAEPVADPGP